MRLTWPPKGAAGVLTLRNSCPTAPLTPTMATDGPSGVFMASVWQGPRRLQRRTDRLCRLLSWTQSGWGKSLREHRCCMFWLLCCGQQVESEVVLLCGAQCRHARTRKYRMIDDSDALNTCVQARRAAAVSAAWCTELSTMLHTSLQHKFGVDGSVFRPAGDLRSRCTPTAPR